MTRLDENPREAKRISTRWRNSNCLVALGTVYRSGAKLSRVDPENWQCSGACLPPGTGTGRGGAHGLDAGLATSPVSPALNSYRFDPSHGGLLGSMHGETFAE